MRIEKEYNVQGLADKVKGCIKTVCETKSRNVSLDVITAQEIVDVLETVASWENKRTKLRDIREEVLKEAPERECFGMHSDDMECTVCLYEDDCKEETEEEKCEKKKTLCDDCLMRYCCNVDCTNEHITKQMLGDLESCFGKSYGRRYATACKTCKYKEQCKELTKHAEA